MEPMSDRGLAIGNSRSRTERTFEKTLVVADRQATSASSAATAANRLSMAATRAVVSREAARLAQILKQAANRASFGAFSLTGSGRFRTSPLLSRSSWAARSVRSAMKSPRYLPCVNTTMIISRPEV
jgi:hypothetical protein